MYWENLQGFKYHLKISKEVHFLGKCEHFPTTDHLHSRYLRMHFRWLLLKFATIFFIETFSVTVTKRNWYFGRKFCRILKKNITCRNFFQRLHVDVPLNTYYIKSSQITSARKVTFPSKFLLLGRSFLSVHKCVNMYNMFTMDF